MLLMFMFFSRNETNVIDGLIPLYNRSRECLLSLVSPLSTGDSRDSRYTYLLSQLSLVSPLSPGDSRDTYLQSLVSPLSTGDTR